MLYTLKRFIDKNGKYSQMFSEITYISNYILYNKLLETNSIEYFKNELRTKTLASDYKDTIPENNILDKFEKLLKDGKIITKLIRQSDDLVNEGLDKPEKKKQKPFNSNNIRGNTKDVLYIEVKRLMESNKSKDIKLRKYKDEINKYVAEKKTYKESFDGIVVDHRREVEKLKNDLEEAKGDIKREDEEFDNLRFEISEQDTVIRDLNEKLERSQNDLEMCINENKELTTEKIHWNDKYNKLETEYYIYLNKTHKRLQRKYKDCMRRKTATQKELDKARDTINAVKEDRISFCEENERLRRYLDESNNDKTILQNKMRKLDKEWLESGEKKCHWELSYGNLFTQMGEENTIMKELQRENVFWKTEYNKSETQIKNKNNYIKDLQKERDLQNKNNVALSESVDKLHLKLLELDEENEALKKGKKQNNFFDKIFPRWKSLCYYVTKEKINELQAELDRYKDGLKVFNEAVKGVE